MGQTDPLLHLWVKYDKRWTINTEILHVYIFIAQ